MFYTSSDTEIQRKYIFIFTFSLLTHRKTYKKHIRHWLDVSKLDKSSLTGLLCRCHQQILQQIYFMLFVLPLRSQQFSSIHVHIFFSLFHFYFCLVFFLLFSFSNLSNLIILHGSALSLCANQSSKLMNYLTSNCFTPTGFRIWFFCIMYNDVLMVELVSVAVTSVFYVD